MVGAGPPAVNEPVGSVLHYAWSMATRISNQHIEVTPGVAGGKPRIVGRRIKVQELWQKLSRSASVIPVQYLYAST